MTLCVVTCWLSRSLSRKTGQRWRSCETGHLWLSCAECSVDSCHPPRSCESRHPSCEAVAQPVMCKLNISHTQLVTNKLSISYTDYMQTWIQDLLIQDQDRDRDSRLTRPILEVHDWDELWQTKEVMASRKSSIPIVAHSKRPNASVYYRISVEV